MEITIIDVLDSAKGSADKITHSLREFGRGDMRKGVEKFFEQTFEMGQKYAFKQVRSDVAKIGVLIFAIGCTGVQTIQHINFKRRISKRTEAMECEAV